MAVVRIVIVRCKDTNIPCPPGPQVNPPGIGPGDGDPGIIPNPDAFPGWISRLDNFFLEQGGDFRVMFVTEQIQSDRIAAELGKVDLGKAVGVKPNKPGKGGAKPGKKLLNAALGALENVAENLIQEHGDELADAALKQASKAAAKVGKQKGMGAVGNIATNLINEQGAKVKDAALKEAGKAAEGISKK